MQAWAWVKRLLKHDEIHEARAEVYEEYEAVRRELDREKRVATRDRRRGGDRRQHRQANG